MSAIHILKTWEESFKAIWYGIKNYEIRVNDRNFQNGDRLILKEYVKNLEQFTGREILCDVTYITLGGDFGLPNDRCVMSIKVVSRRTGMSDG